MFRKREMSTLEKSLIGLGVAVRSDTGQALFSKMVELGYSDKEVSLRVKEVPNVIVVKEKNTDTWLISIKTRRDRCREDGTWEIELWWWSLELNDTEGIDVYSKYDIYGKLILDV